MAKRVVMCSLCNSEIPVNEDLDPENPVKCLQCNERSSNIQNINKKNMEISGMKELETYPISEPYAYVKILKDETSLEKYYWIIEPELEEDESKVLKFIQDALINSIDVRLDQLESESVENFLIKNINKILKDYQIKISDDLKNRILFYIKRKFIGYGRIDALMKDPNIEDISCDGSSVPVFLYHRKYDSLKSNIKFDDEDELSAFVVLLSQKCGKHISKAKPMLDATMPDGSRIQMTLSTEITTKGSTFTIRKFRSDPITPTDLIEYKSMSADIIAYMWMAVEHGINALIAGGTASGKTSALNAISLFIPRESKIVSIEETREINLPHSNWIPGVARVGFGERIKDRLIGEIDLFDLMKAALRQRPEYILVGEIRGREAYVLFQAMATGHTTYSTVHADSAKALVHRLEGKPIEIPRAMLQALDIVVLQTNIQREDKNVRRCKQIVEIIDIDSFTDEILTNEVFHWDPVEDKFVFSGKSYVLEKLRTHLGLSKEEMAAEIARRVEILKWMHKNNIRVFRDVAKIVSAYIETPEDLMNKIRNNTMTFKDDIDNSIDKNIANTNKNKEFYSKELDLDKKKNFSLFFNKRKKKKTKDKTKEKIDKDFHKEKDLTENMTKSPFSIRLKIRNKKKLEDVNDSNTISKNKL
jgi:flagellar protein FlaI